MQEIYRIPLENNEGVYRISELSADDKEALELTYDDYGDIVTYETPYTQYGRTIRLYGIPKNVLDNTLQVEYGFNGQVKTLAVRKDDKDTLLYIHFEDNEDAKKVIEEFAVANAKVILDKIAMCKEPVSRLFVEYFNDGESMDFHAKIGTEAEKLALEKAYRKYKDIADSCGDYKSENLEGDNEKLAILVSCADNDDEDFFQNAVDTMVEIIQEQGSALLNKAADFKFICAEYD